MADDNKDKDLAFVDNTPVLDAKPGAPKTAGMAVIDITHTIPTTGKRKITTKWEYWTVCAFCMSLFVYTCDRPLTLPSLWGRRCS